MLSEFRLDLSNPLSPEQQIINQLNVFQEIGLLNSPHQLPSVRELAVQLHIAPTIVETAYKRWQQEGLNHFLSPVIAQAKDAGYTKEQIEIALDQIWLSLE
jgi:DNA-binding transcriptional MocR family regulator